jgi:hypothetical protein
MKRPANSVRRIAVIGMMMTLVGANAQPASAAPPSVDPQRLGAELRFRLDFGFRSDQAYVQQLIASLGSEFDGPVLTDSERAEMDRRQAMETEMEPLESAAEVMPGFAGHWIDQPAGGIITVAFNGGADKHLADLQRIAPPASEVRVLDVPYSLADLRDLAARVESDFYTLLNDGVQLAHWGVDISENRVIVGVIGLNDDMRAYLEGRYGDAVVAVPADPQVTGCTGRESCIGPPLRAGISGAPSGTGYDNRCSIAFLLHYGSYTQWLTAGHCAQTTGVVWYHAGNPSWPIGTIKATCWPQCNYSDAARAGNVSSTYASQKVYLTTSSTFNVTGSQGYNGDDEGNITCINARRSGYDCGYIDHIGTMNYGGVWFYEMRFATYQSYYGDSGGAVHSYPSGYYNVVAYGVQSGCTDLEDGVCVGLGVYSHIYRVLQEIGGSVCSTNDPCP